MQFDVYRNVVEQQKHIPYLVDIQSDILSLLHTRVVVPLIRPAAFGRQSTRLHPTLQVDDEDLVLAAHLMAAMDRRRLRAPVASLAHVRDLIVAAVDVVLTGV